MAGPRPLRALPRPLEPDPVQPALPVRLRPDDGRPRGLPHVGQPHARPPRARAHGRRRDHHRTAGPGPGDRRRHGDGRPLRARPVRPRRAGRHQPLRPPRLGASPATATSRRASPPRRPPSPGCSTSTDSSSSTTTTTSRSRATPPSPSTRTSSARYRAYGWATHRVDMNADGSIDVEGVHAADRGRPGRAGPPDVHPGAHHHRLARAEPAEHRQGRTAAPSASRRSARPRRCWAWIPTRTSPSRRTCSAACAPTCAIASTSSAGHGTPSFAAWRAAHPDNAALLDRLQAHDLPDGFESALPAFAAGGSVSTRKASGEVINALAAVMPELWGGSADLAESNNTTIEGAASFLPAGNPIAGRLALRPGPALRHPRARHGRDPQRHRPRRADPPLRRHVPRVLRLHARRRAPVGAHGHRRHVRVDARLHRARRGRPHPSAGRAPVGPARDPRTSPSCARPTPTRRPPPGGRSCTSAIPPGWSSPGRTCPVLPADAEAVRTGVARGAYVAARVRRPAGPAPGDRLGGAARARGGRRSSRAEGIGARVVSMPCLEWFDAQERGVPRHRPRRRRCAPASPSRPARRWGGGATSAMPAGSSGWTTSGPAPTRRSSSASSASPPRTSSRPRATASPPPTGD